MQPSEPHSGSASDMQTEARATFRLGRWTVYPAELRLTDGEDDVRLQPKEMILLLALCDGGRRPMTAEQVRRRVWGEQAITDGAAKNLVWQLRNSLGETAQKPNLIETVPGAGYRLRVLPQAIEGAAPSSRPAMATEANGSRAEGTRRWLPWLGLSIIVAGLVLWAGLFEREREGPDYNERGPEAVRPVTGLPGREAEIDLDPTGRHLLFSWSRDIRGQADLFRFDLQDPRASPIRLSATPELSEIAGRFSPDGRRIAFAALSRNGRLELRVMPASGGAAKVITVLSSISEPELAWRGDGEALFLAWWPDPEKGSVLHRVPLATGIPEPLFEADSEWWDRVPTVSPSGDRLAFLRQTGPYGGELRLLHLASGKEETIATIAGRLGTLDWQGDGEHLLFTARLAGHSSTIYRVPADGASGPEIFATTAGMLDVGEVTAAAGTIALEQSDFDVDLLRFDDIGKKKDATAHVVAVSDRAEVSPQLSPDGRRLAFLSDRSGHFELWLHEEGELRRLHVEGVVPASNPRWSPDGRLIVLSVLKQGQQDLVVVRPSDGASQDDLVEPITDTPEREMLPSWRPDGLAVRFHIPGHPQAKLWEQELWDPESRRPLSARGEATAALSEDRLLFSIGGEGLFLLDLESDTEPRRLELDIAASGWGRWDATDDGIYSLMAGSREVHFYRFADASLSTLLELERPAAGYGIDVTDDGATLFVSVVIRDNSRILTVGGESPGDR